MLDFATKLRLTRVLLNWRQCKLAREIGVSVATVSAWETGIQEPYIRTQRLLVILAERHGLEINERGYPEYAPKRQNNMEIEQGTLRPE
jgi:transcriptional regulator with XRE-family HTH domain